jgi:hypothetical protein
MKHIEQEKPMNSNMHKPSMVTMAQNPECVNTASTMQLQWCDIISLGAGNELTSCFSTPSTDLGWHMVSTLAARMA